MIEIHLAKREKELVWDLTATVLPHEGLGLAQEAVLTSIQSDSFALAARAIAPLSSVSFSPNPNRWPVPEPKIRIFNERNHSDREHFGNYRVEKNGRVLGRIEDFPRNNRDNTVELIRAAMALAVSAD